MIVVEQFKGRSVVSQSVEIVERKGVGHPDTICDSVMEAVSIALCREYQRVFGSILHHNIDKGMLAAGSTVLRFGGGRVRKPMEFIIGDRATFVAGGKRLPVRDVAVEAVKAWLRANVRLVDPDKHVKYRVVLAPGSEELTDIFSRPGAIRCANDTSAAVGYYPLSPVENAVLAMEQFLNAKVFKKQYPETGEDVKVMGLRIGHDLDLTVAMPLLAGHIRSEREYFDRKDAVLTSMTEFSQSLAGFKRRRIHFNTLDAPGRGIGGVYLSLLGTSAEDADSGQVGRGNRVNGLISLNRPMGTEAAAGKNPVSHVGKIYNVLAHRIAMRICEGIDGVQEAYVFLLSRIGSRIDQPNMATAQLLLRKGMRMPDVRKRASGIIEQELLGISQFCRDLSKGRYPVC